MKALLINSGAEIQEVDIETVDDIRNLIGFKTIDSFDLGTQGDRLYFDEWCYLHESTGRFQVDGSIPLSGNAVVVGVAEDGASLRDAKADIDDLRGRIRYQ